jgi:hypothetical protein
MRLEPVNEDDVGFLPRFEGVMKWSFEANPGRRTFAKRLPK